MRKIIPFSHNGSMKSCAGCCQPFVVRNGWSEAIVGQDGRLYCYGTSCEPVEQTHRAVSKKAA